MRSCNSYGRLANKTRKAFARRPKIDRIIRKMQLTMSDVENEENWDRLRHLLRPSGLCALRLFARAELPTDFCCFDCPMMLDTESNNLQLCNTKDLGYATNHSELNMKGSDRAEFISLLRHFVSRPSEQTWRALSGVWFSGYECTIAIENTPDPLYICELNEYDEDEELPNLTLCPFDKYNQNNGPCATYLKKLSLATRMQCCLEILTDLETRT